MARLHFAILNASAVTLSRQSHEVTNLAGYRDVFQKSIPGTGIKRGCMWQPQAVTFVGRTLTMEAHERRRLSVVGGRLSALLAES